MSQFGWALLKHAVHAEARARTAGVASIDPTACVLLMLACALTLAITQAGRHVVLVALTLAARPMSPVAALALQRHPTPIPAPERQGARGPRAPTAALVG